MQIRTKFFFEELKSYKQFYSTIYSLKFDTDCLYNQSLNRVWNIWRIIVIVLTKSFENSITIRSWNVKSGQLFNELCWSFTLYSECDWSELLVGFLLSSNLRSVDDCVSGTFLNKTL